MIDFNSKEKTWIEKTSDNIKRGLTEATNVAAMQRDLYITGYFGNISRKKAIDGKMGPMTRAAMRRAKRDGLSTSPEAYSRRDNTPQYTTNPITGQRVDANGNPVKTKRTSNNTFRIISNSPKRTNSKDNIFLSGFESRESELQGKTVRDVQQELLKRGYLKGSKYGVDGKWGNETERAYQKYLKDKAYEIPTAPISLNNYSLQSTKLNEKLPKIEYAPVTFDRTQTRDWMRGFDINPYDYNGSVRRALRLYHNNEAGDNEKAILRQYPELVQKLGLKLRNGKKLLYNPFRV